MSSRFIFGILLRSYRLWESHKAPAAGKHGDFQGFCYPCISPDLKWLSCCYLCFLVINYWLCFITHCLVNVIRFIQPPLWIHQFDVAGRISSSSHHLFLSWHKFHFLREAFLAYPVNLYVILSPITLFYFLRTIISI